ncbi:peptidase [Metabacillus herbersteinensis]|uniref:Peptidase n=1 Tax=Metabacillus herbersteinensis TaxID=283816 RepID=A0ABV6GMI5_9BACI
MKEQKQKAWDWIESNKQNGVQLLQKLVQEKSVQHEEAPAQAIILEKCRQLQLEIDLWEPGGISLRTHPEFVSTRPHFQDSPNIVAILKGTGKGRSVILNGHIDVVPEGEQSQWHDDPYSAKVNNGRVYGRGSTDMKGGNVSLLLAIEAIKESKIPLKGDVIFQSVIEEESGGAGTLAAILRGYKADAAIIPEPTNLKIFAKQQGSMWFRLKVKGRSAHGGTRYEGVSAIEKSYSVIEHIKELETNRNQRITDTLYKNIPIPIPINIGKISGGTWPSSVADTVVLEGRCGIAPDETVETVKVEFSNYLDTLKEKDIWFGEHPVEIEWFGARWLPNDLSLQHDIIQILSNEYKLIKSEDPTIEASPWGTDGGLLATVGNIPTVVFGPGTTEVAHFPNEYIEIDKMIDSAKIIVSFLIEWCGVLEE